ncbi:hypothetical protein, partial [Rhodococcus koreensis]
ARFHEQATALRELLTTAPPDADQQKDLVQSITISQSAMYRRGCSYVPVMDRNECPLLTTAGK